MPRALRPLLLVLLVGLFAFPSAAFGAPGGRADYIIVLDRAVANVPALAAEHAQRFGVDVELVYQHALKGYAASLPEDKVGALLGDRRVAFVERDSEVRTFGTQVGAPWGLDRIDQTALPLSGTFTYGSTGTGVTAYVIDTGIRLTHTDFGGRAVDGYDAVDGSLPADDCNGHGTHVAGTVGGSTYGVAKSVTLVAVRVLNCSGSGSNSGVIAGIDWVTADHDAGEPAVANMSLGGSTSSALDTAVRNSIADGVTYAIAAGNGNIFGYAQNACRTSPARVTEAITVSASDATDRKASWANYGNCIDWFAPGVSITSGWYTSDTATSTISGTSMATPHVAGVAALYLSTQPSASPNDVRAALYALTSKGVVRNARSTNNHLLFTNY